MSMKTISFYHEAAADFEAKSSMWDLNPDGSPRLESRAGAS